MKTTSVTIYVLVDAEGSMIADADIDNAMSRWSDDYGGAWERMLTLELAVDIPEAVAVKVPCGSVLVSAK